MFQFRTFGKTLMVAGIAILMTSAAQAQGIGSDAGATGTVDRGGVPGSAKSTTAARNSSAGGPEQQRELIDKGYWSSGRDAGNRQANEYNEKNRR